MAITQLWLPRMGTDVATFESTKKAQGNFLKSWFGKKDGDVNMFGRQNKPRLNYDWFMGRRLTAKWTITDALTGDSHEYKEDIHRPAGTNSDYIWKDGDNSNFYRVGGESLDDAWMSISYGDPHRDEAWWRSHDCHRLPGITGLEFKYRWPDAANNYTEDCPFYIDMMHLSYGDLTNGEVRHYTATCMNASPADKKVWPNTWDEKRSVRNNDWKGAYYSISDEAKKDSADRGLFLVGFQISFLHPKINTGKLEPVRMDIKNMQLVFEAPGGARPLIPEPDTDAWAFKPRQFLTTR